MDCWIKGQKDRLLLKNYYYDLRVHKLDKTIHSILIPWMCTVNQNIVLGIRGRRKSHNLKQEKKKKPTKQTNKQTKTKNNNNKKQQQKTTKKQENRKQQNKAGDFEYQKLCLMKKRTFSNICN